MGYRLKRIVACLVLVVVFYVCIRAKGGGVFSLMLTQGFGSWMWYALGMLISFFGLRVMIPQIFKGPRKENLVEDKTGQN